MKWSAVLISKEFLDRIESCIDTARKQFSKRECKSNNGRTRTHIMNGIRLQQCIEQHKTKSTPEMTSKLLTVFDLTMKLLISNNSKVINMEKNKKKWKKYIYIIAHVGSSAPTVYVNTVPPWRLWHRLLFAEGILSAPLSCAAVSLLNFSLAVHFTSAEQLKAMQENTPHHICPEENNVCYSHLLRS